MRKLKAFIAQSMDGLIADANGDLEFLHLVANDIEDYGYADFMAGIDTLVMGRNTYETIRLFPDWPYDGKRVIVVGASPMSEEDPRIERWNDAFIDRARQLKAEDGQDIYVDGGRTISLFLDAGMIDELIISTVPIVLGRGTPLFSGIRLPWKYRLLKSTSFEKGLVQNHYVLDHGQGAE
jgi:dihydrofolate reductase